LQCDIFVNATQTNAQNRSNGAQNRIDGRVLLILGLWKFFTARLKVCLFGFGVLYSKSNDDGRGDFLVQNSDLQCINVRF